MKKLFKLMMFNAPLRAKQAAQNSKNPGRAVFAAGPKTQKHQNSKKNRRAREKFFWKNYPYNMGALPAVI